MAGADELEEALRRHPDWDEGLPRELARGEAGPSEERRLAFNKILMKK
ncbi:hypothetical protein [Acidilobus sp. 7A]|nr:hypothetical protein [Acidilobus sp. 7A]